MKIDVQSPGCLSMWVLTRKRALTSAVPAVVLSGQFSDLQADLAEGGGSFWISSRTILRAGTKAVMRSLSFV